MFARGRLVVKQDLKLLKIRVSCADCKTTAQTAKRHGFDVHEDTTRDFRVKIGPYSRSKPSELEQAVAVVL